MGGECPIDQLGHFHRLAQTRRMTHLPLSYTLYSTITTLSVAGVRLWSNMFTDVNGNVQMSVLVLQMNVSYLPKALLIISRESLHHIPLFLNIFPRLQTTPSHHGFFLCFSSIVKRSDDKTPLTPVIYTLGNQPATEDDILEIMCSQW